MALTPENLTENNNYYNIIAEKIREKVNIDRLGETELFNCYWISGKGIAGGVAAELAYLYGTEEVYCYTFGSPYTHKGSGNQYAPYVKNIINEDDLLTKVISAETGFSRIGEIYNKSINIDLQKEYKAYIGVSSSSYKGDCSRINTMIRQILKFVKGEPSTREVLLAALSKNTGNGSTSVIMSPLTTVINDATIEISNTSDVQKDASSTKSYYVLSKVLEGINKSVGKDDKYQRINEQPSSDVNVEGFNGTLEEIVGALKKVANWYVNNVYTYMKKKKYDNAFGFYEIGQVHTGFKKFDNVDGVVEYKQGGNVSVEFGKGNFDLTLDNNYDAEVEITDENGIKNTYKYIRKPNNDGMVILYIKASDNALNANKPYSEDDSLVRYYNGCELFSEDELIKGGYDTEFSYTTPGDDCTRFAFIVFELGLDKDVSELGNRGDDASQFADADDSKGTIVKMKNYFDIYTGEDLKKVFNKEFTGNDAYKNGIQDGDMLVGTIADGNSRNHCEFIYDVKNNKVFGWGNVKLSTNSSWNPRLDGNYIKNGFDNDFKYSVLYRKKR